MTPDQYLMLILGNYQHGAGVLLARLTLDPIITRWAGVYLNSITQSGSIAKGTAVKGGSDLDIFVSIKSSCPDNLSAIYSTLGHAFTQAGYRIRNQNVSIGINVGNVTVDITPGQQQPGLYTTDHSIWKNKHTTWTKTNIQTHIATVQNCGRIPEIRLVKIWRNCHQLDFPSFYLELVVIEALLNTWEPSISNRFIMVMNYLSSRFQNARFIDPANSANVISDDLSSAEKATIANKAAQALNDLQSDWRRVIW
jgi:hypothetical protein